MYATVDLGVPVLISDSLYPELSFDGCNCWLTVFAISKLLAETYYNRSIVLTISR